MTKRPYERDTTRSQEARSTLGTVPAGGVDADSTETQSHRWTVIVGVALIVAAITIRLWGIEWGLPYVYHPDEPFNLDRSLAMLQEQDANPHWFHYPSLFFYIHAGGQLAYYGTGSATGAFDSIDDIPRPETQTMGNTRLADSNSLLTGRLLTVAFSVATVMIVYWGVISITGSLFGATLAGALITFGPLSVRTSRWLTPDPIAMFFTAAALAASFRVVRRGRTIDYAVAGVLVGLAGASKYNAALVGLTVVTAHIMRTGRGFARERGDSIAGIASVAAFIIASPYVLLDFYTFWSDFSFELNHYSTGHPGAEGGSPLFYGQTLVAEYGLLLFLVPFGVVSRPGRREAFLASGFALIYLAFISRFIVRFDRNLLPVLPAMAMAIGIGAAGSTHLLRRRLSAGRTRRPTLAISALCATILAVGVGLPMRQTVADARALSSDERAEARAWIDAYIPIGSTILVEGYSPFVDPQRFVVTPVNFAAIESDSGDQDYVVITESASGRFLSDPDKYAVEAARYEEQFGDYCEVAFFAGPPWIRVLNRCR